MISVEKIRPREDNVLVRFDEHARARGPEEVSRGGIVLPRSRKTEANEAVVATVLAAGPGHYADKWLGREEGLAPDGSRKFLPMNPGLVAGVRVLVQSPHAGDPIMDDEIYEYRMVRENQVIAILEEDS